MNLTKVVLGVVGMPGAGKTLVDETAIVLGYRVVVMGDVVREEAKALGLDPTPENMGNLMLQLREKEGAQVIAKRCISKIQKANSRLVVVDGLRSLEEVDKFRKSFREFKVLCIHASPETRFRRLYGRGRGDDPKSWTAFAKRDHRELGLGIGSVIALADFMIENEGTVNQLKATVKRLIQRQLV